jgi:ligand-binding sensor domain-containing protein
LISIGKPIRKKIKFGRQKSLLHRLPVTLSHSTAKYFLFLILSFGCKVFAHEQSDDLQKLGAADGLSQGMVYQISQDRNGFLWIGTKNGLNRFDGFQFYPLDSTTNGMDISNITITCQMEDEYGRLWIGTEGEGLFILDQKSGLVYPCVARKGNTAIPAHILNIKQNEGGNIWIGAFKGLYKVDPQAIEFPGSEKQSVEVVLDQVYRAEGFCRAIHFQKDRVFWSEDQRVFSASLKHFGIFQEHTSEWQTGLRSGSINIEHIFEDKRGQLWIVRSHAITIVNKDWVVHHYFNVPTSSPKIGFAQVSDSSFLVSANYLKLVHADGSGTLVSDTLSYLNNFYARDVFRDHSGMIWMGTNGYGLLKFNPFRQQLGHIAEGRSFQNISKISPGRILAWSQFALWEIDAQWNSISKSKDIPPYLLTARNVITDSQGKLWFHFPNKDQAPALVSWNPANGSIDSILYNALPYYISPMYKDAEGLLWMASTDGVLMRINLTKKEVQYFDFKSMASKEGSALFINSIYQDKAGIYWLATSVGLFEFKLIQNSIQNLKYHSLQKEKVMPYYVFEVLADEKEDGLLWLCTRGNGLVKFHKKKGVLKVYTKKSGLPDNVVYGAISSGRALMAKYQ